MRAALEGSLQRLAAGFERPGTAENPDERDLRAMLARDIARYLSRPAGAPAGGAAAPGAPSDPPPGPPIGGWDADDECGWTPN